MGLESITPLGKGDHCNTTPSRCIPPSAPLFTIKESDYLLKQSGVDSSFDRLLKDQWNSAVEAGVMKYDIRRHSLPSRVISSKDYKFIASLIEGRAPGKRRQPDEMLSLRMPFDPLKFNFTKIEPNELLFKVKYGDLEHSVLVNKSPIEFCSSLLVPSLEQCLPQVLTDESLSLAIQVLALSDHQSLRLGFNSLGAMASVNHQHWHIYYFFYKLTIEDLPVKDNVLQGWPIPAIVFELNELSDEHISDVVCRAMKIVTFSINAGIAHNLFLSRTASGSIRLFIWLVEPRFGAKNDLNINPAFCEFSGYFICKTTEMFSNIDETMCVKLLHSVTSKHSQVLHLL